MMYKILAIDPGSSSGAVAWKDRENEIQVANLPGELEDLAKFIAYHTAVGDAHGNHLHWVCEDVGGSMPGNAAKSARTFATHLGHIEALVMVDCRNPLVKVGPKKWMYWLADQCKVDLPKGMENKKARKDVLFEELQKMHPTLKFTKRQADAVGILTWALAHLPTVTIGGVDNQRHVATKEWVKKDNKDVVPEADKNNKEVV